MHLAAPCRRTRRRRARRRPARRDAARERRAEHGHEGGARREIVEEGAARPARASRFPGAARRQGRQGRGGWPPERLRGAECERRRNQGTTSDTATTVLASGTLPAGKYAFNAQVSLHGLADVVVSCQAQGPGSAGPRIGAPASLHVGTGAGAARDGTLPLAFAATFAAPGSVYVGCWIDNGSAEHPTATSSDLVALTIGSLSGP